MSAPAPLAQGTLEATPLAHVFLSLHRRSLSGTLAVWPDDDRRGQDRILVRNGVPLAARLLEPTETLERGILLLFQRTHAAYALYEGDLVGEGEGVLTGSVDPVALVLAGMRGGVRDAAVDGVLEGFGTSPLRLVAKLDAHTLRLTPKESAFLELLRAEPATAEDLIARSGEEKVARRMLYLLGLLGALEAFRGTVVEAMASGHPPPPAGPLGAPGAPPVAPAEPVAQPAARIAAPRTSMPAPAATSERRRRRGLEAPPPAPRAPAGLAAALAEQWNALAERIDAADGQTYFQMLGVGESPDGSIARDAYFELVKKVHPDRLPPELEPLRGHAARLFQQLTEAKEHLEDDEKRMKYIRTVRDGGGTPGSDRKMMAVLSAAHELDKANVLVNMSKWSEALEALAEAKACDPSQADIYALEAFILFQQLGQIPSATVENIVTLCDRVLADASGGFHERALFVKGMCLKKQGKDDQAAALFKKIVEKNPRNVDAAREVRLHEMRTRGTSKSDGRASLFDLKVDTKDVGGLIGKLFGPKKGG